MTTHAHVDSQTRDCDSLYTNCYIMWMDGKEQDDDFGDIQFRNRVASHVVNTYTCVSGVLKVEGDAETGMTQRMEWSESTEEGFRNYDVRFCEDTYCEDETTYRDHTAESMGY